MWHVAPPLDLAAMQEGARHLVGHHDFSTFRDSLCQAKSPVKTLDALDLSRVGDEIHIEARARSFLHHQVRNMAGTLKLVGLGSWRPDDVARALAARDRRAGGPTAPAEGLDLVAVALRPGSVERLGDAAELTSAEQPDRQSTTTDRLRAGDRESDAGDVPFVDQHQRGDRDAKPIGDAADGDRQRQTDRAVQPDQREQRRVCGICDQL